MVMRVSPGRSIHFPILALGARENYEYGVGEEYGEMHHKLLLSGWGIRLLIESGWRGNSRPRLAHSIPKIISLAKSVRCYLGPCSTSWKN